MLQIYNHVASGFTDGNPYLRELTLKSMAVLGPKLSQRTLSQSLLKHLAKLQVGVLPGYCQRHLHTHAPQACTLYCPDCCVCSA